MPVSGSTSKSTSTARLAQTLPYKIEIFRLGYYGGDGARLVATLNNPDGTVQPNPLYDPSLGLVDAGNWVVTDSWQMPADAVSGVYLARLQRLDANGDPIDGAVNQIPFIVRERWSSPLISCCRLPTRLGRRTTDGPEKTARSALTSMATRAARLTIRTCLIPASGHRTGRTPSATTGRSSPATVRARLAGAQDYLFGADYAAIYWLERNGYDVTYISDVDADRLGTSWFEDANGNNIRKAYISVGHDEYWSGAQRANVEAARDAGVNLLFWSGNEVYWRTRYADSIDRVGDRLPHARLLQGDLGERRSDCWARQTTPISIPSNEWTGTWRDLRFVDSVDANGVHTAVGAPAGKLADRPALRS